jgi:hypothetical protein
MSRSLLKKFFFSAVSIHTMPAINWSRNVPMEKFIKCLIWLQFIPVTQDKNSGYWHHSKQSFKLLLMMGTLVLTSVYYSWTILWQAFTRNESSSMNDWTILVYKIFFMPGPSLYPFLMGAAASAQETRASYSRLQIPVTTITFLSCMILLCNLGIVGIHVKEIIYDPTCLAPIAVSTLISFLTFVACILVIYTWIHDLIANCPDGDQQVLIEVTGSDLFLHKYECLRSGTEYFLMVLLSFVQILLIFSLYQSVRGKH